MIFKQIFTLEIKTITKNIFQTTKFLIMTNKQILSELLVELGNITNTPTSKQQAIDENKEFYLMLEHSTTYGGYRLIRVRVDGGGHLTAFNYFTSCGQRLKAPAMIEKIRSFIAGIEYAKSL